MVLLLHCHVKPHWKSVYLISDKITGNAKVNNANYLMKMIENNMCSQLYTIKFYTCHDRLQHHLQNIRCWKRVFSISFLKETLFFGTLPTHLPSCISLQR